MNQSLVRIGARIINISQVHHIKMITPDYVVISFDSEHILILHGDEAAIFLDQVTQIIEINEYFLNRNSTGLSKGNTKNNSHE